MMIMAFECLDRFLSLEARGSSITRTDVFACRLQFEPGGAARVDDDAMDNDVEKHHRGRRQDGRAGMSSAIVVSGFIQLVSLQ